MIKKFIKFKPDDPVMAKILDNIESIFDSIFQSKMIDGKLIKNVKFTANQDTVIATGLNRPYEGWMISDQTQFARFKRSATTNTKTDSRIILVSDADTIASLWIF